MAWFLAGWVPLMLVSYAPNRYLLPVLPPLALMVGIGAQSLAVWHRGSWRMSTAAATALAVGLAAPHLAMIATWVRSCDGARSPGDLCPADPRRSSRSG